MSPASVPSARALVAVRALVLALTVALLGIFVLWHVIRFSAPTALLASTLGVVPWLLTIPAFRRGTPNVYLGALLLTTPYLGYALMEILANPGARTFAAATLFVSFALAVVLVAALRISRRRAAAPT